MSSEEKLRQIMRERFQIDSVIDKYRDRFRQTLMDAQEKTDWQIEGFSDPSKQRDLSIKFFWGHNHDFGEFSLQGLMADRHIQILAEFMDGFGLPEDLQGKKVLDIGVWTGGTCLLMSALGAKVTALEEVRKYADMVNYLAAAFDLKDLECRSMSVYDLDDHDEYDYVIYSGVIYHVSDPVLSLRILFNALKDNGKLFVETLGINANPQMPPLALVEGPQITKGGSAEELNRGGWNYYIPSPTGLGTWIETVGFEQINVAPVDAENRIKGVATRVQHQDMLRAGLSRPDIR